MEKVTLQKRLATAIRNRREHLGYSQESFADTIGMHRAYYSAIERGEKNPTAYTLMRVSVGLGWDLALLTRHAGV